MKKFDLTLALSGHEVITKDGKPVQILYSKRDGNFPIVAIIENSKVSMYTETGKFYIDKNSKNDLYLK